MSIRVGLRAMGRALGKIIPPWVPVLIFSDDFDWKDEFDFYKKFGEDFSGWEYTDGHLMPPMDLIFSEDFSGWP